MSATAFEKRLQLAQEVFATVRIPGWDYTVSESAQMLYAIAVDDGWLFVLGNPDAGEYEWLYQPVRGTQKPCWSNDGFGSPAVAMLAGLSFLEC